MDKLEELKKKGKLTRQDVADLLTSLGEPGKNREEKLGAIRELSKKNGQGFSIEMTLDSYQEY